MNKPLPEPAAASHTAPGHATGWPAADPIAAWRALSGGHLGWALGWAFTVALLLNPIFEIPFVALLGRTSFVALSLVVAFVAAGRWRQTLMPQWVVQTVAVGLTAPLATLAVYMMATGGDLRAFVGNPGRLAGFAWISSVGLIVGVMIGLGALLREREAQARNLALAFELERTRLERQALDARLALLSAQIEPHFLFNTLANVQALVDSGSPRAGEVLRSLTAYLRAALPRLQGAGLPLLDDELRLVRAYLELMQLRMPDRLRFAIEVDSELAQTVRFPPMALLTLVENAIRHGIDPSEDGGTVIVGGSRSLSGGGEVSLWVSDTGVGLDLSAPPGTGLANLRERLQGIFGSTAQLELSEQSPHGVRADIGFRPLAEPPGDSGEVRKQNPD
jgi:hypothetical protein